MPKMTRFIIPTNQQASTQKNKLEVKKIDIKCQSDWFPRVLKIKVTLKGLSNNYTSRV